ncbi:MAG: SDR family oxidoreductase [Pseudomonadota bacterium]|nr:short-chain dehydrogenase [Pseudomonadales bacterium]MDY6920740.1 SDR family oxidoreductase [Pseudomonadota bacterium]
MALTNALITGASAGIGYEISKLLAAQGHDLVLVARREDRLQQLADYLRREYGIAVRVLALDLSQPQQIDTLYQTLERENIPVDILVNNAGVGSYAAFTKTGMDSIQQQLDLNIQALTLLCRRFAEDMARRGLGKILNIASLSGFMPGPYLAVYHASKAYVVALSEALQAELKGTGVSVTVSCPGPVATEFHGVAGTTGSLFLKLLPMQSAAQVAGHAVSAMDKRRTVAVPGLFNQLLMLLARLTPRPLLLWCLKQLLRPRS